MRERKGMRETRGMRMQIEGETGRKGERGGVCEQESKGKS